LNRLSVVPGFFYILTQKKMMILVTGATGLVGSHLLAELLHSGYKVRATKRPDSSTDQVYKTLDLHAVKPETFKELLTWIEADLINPLDVEKAINGINLVYHTAAMVTFDPSYRREVIRCNVEITRNIVNACLDHQVNKLCYVSSTAALGTSLSDEDVTEDSPWLDAQKQSAYSRSKHFSEMEVWRGIAEGLNAVIVNPSIILGPGNWTRTSSGMFKVVWDGLKYYTEGVTGYVDVKDVVRSMIWLAHSEISGERFIISAENLSCKEILQMISKALDKKPPGRLATPFLTGIVWRLDWLRNKLTGKERVITREIIRAGRKKKYFSSKKIIETTGIEFIPVARSVEETAAVFLSSQGTY
jgi:dihydroflavonol-4-reductase